MNAKKRPNKLDRYAEQLQGWLGVEKITLDEAVSRLRDLGCSSARSSVSVWWERQYREQMEEKLLGQIASGARQCKEIEASLGKNGAPELETLIRLHRVLILKLSTEANANPDSIELVAQMMKPVMDYAKLEEKRREQNLAEQKYRDLVSEKKTAIERELNAAKNSGGISAETREKIERELKLL